MLLTEQPKDLFPTRVSTAQTQRKFTHSALRAGRLDMNKVVDHLFPIVLFFRHIRNKATQLLQKPRIDISNDLDLVLLVSTLLRGH